MASIKFIVEDDKPVALSCSGSTLEIVSLVAYLIGNIYRILCGRSAEHGKAFQKMVSISVADPKSPTWSIGADDRTMDISIIIPKGKNGGGGAGDG